MSVLSLVRRGHKWFCFIRLWFACIFLPTLLFEPDTHSSAVVSVQCCEQTELLLRFFGISHILSHRCAGRLPSQVVQSHPTHHARDSFPRPGDSYYPVARPKLPDIREGLLGDCWEQVVDVLGSGSEPDIHLGQTPRSSRSCGGGFAYFHDER